MSVDHEMAGKCHCLQTFKRKRLRTLIPLFMPGLVHSDSASWDDCGPVFPAKLRVSCLDSGSLGQRVYACWGLTCHLLFWQNDWGLLHATAVKRSWSGHQIRVSAQVSSGEENSPAALAKIQTRNLLITRPVLLPASYPSSRTLLRL